MTVLAKPAPNTVVAVKGTVEASPPGQPAWSGAKIGQILEAHYLLRTGAQSQAAIRLSDLSVLRVGELSQYEIIPPETADGRPALDLKRGTAYFFSRDRPQEIQLRTPVVAGAIRGTEFNVTVREDGATEVTMLEGEVDLSNAKGSVTLTNRQQGSVRPQEAPRRTAALNTINIIQWTLYYPGVVDPAELAFPAAAQEAVGGSVEAYAAGDLPAALRLYPAGRTPATEAERVYLAAILLAGGFVNESEHELAGVPKENPQAGALEELAAAAKFEEWTRRGPAQTASEWLAESYYRQSRADLNGALAAARSAVEKSPSFGFGWERVAELEFSFGHVPQSEEALTNALRFAPRNAQAEALRGFLFLARDRVAEAETAFSLALEIDPMLSEAWLGRGLGRIHAGRAEEGRADLETAVVLEPNRSVLRSYLGKAYANAELATRNPELRRRLASLALAELNQAKRRDPADPTPWLYAALILYNEYRDAEAIENLEKSESLNDNRQVYRSRLLLDQDQAVRSANLANIYKDAGMVDVSLAEAARATAFDYANFSAHLNLASTYDELRDPTRFNLRYESAWFNESLLSSMLAPLGAVSLSQNLSQEEYSRLFETSHLGFYGTAEFFSDGEFRQTATQYGTEGPMSYAIDLDSDYANGQRVNNDLSRTEVYTRAKYQVTPQDSLLVLTKYENYAAGDNFQHYDPSEAEPAYHFTETQTPLVLAGWHHEWSPGEHTLILAGRLENKQKFTDTNAIQLVNQVIAPVSLIPAPFDVDYQNSFAVYSAEINQIAEREKHTDIFGLRYQEGTFQGSATLDNPPAGTTGPGSPMLPAIEQSSADGGFNRLSAYEYHHWEIMDNLLLIGGVAYDGERYPANYRRPPLENVESTKNQLSPKGALIWQAAPQLTLRGVYSQGLGGVSYDESVRLEPTQLAGFDQTFRSLISESLVGSVEAPRYTLAGGAADWRIARKTWLTLEGSVSTEDVASESGYFTINYSQPAVAANTPQVFDYAETTVRATLNQIVGEEWFLQGQYQFSHSDLQTTLPSVVVPTGADRTTTEEGDLNQISLTATWQSPYGWFAEGQALWDIQSLHSENLEPSLPAGRSFVQLNVYAGYRFRNRRAEITIGGLNLTGGDYHLEPINYYLDLPHSRLFYARVRISL